MAKNIRRFLEIYLNIIFWTLFWMLTYVKLVKLMLMLNLNIFIFEYYPEMLLQERFK